MKKILGTTIVLFALSSSLAQSSAGWIVRSATGFTCPASYVPMTGYISNTLVYAQTRLDALVSGKQQQNLKEGEQMDVFCWRSTFTSVMNSVIGSNGVTHQGIKVRIGFGYAAPPNAGFKELRFNNYFIIEEVNR